MEIRHLKLVEAVAEEGSLTKAVDRLFLTQSALSHQLKEMETQLGAPIFHRVNKKLVLTGVGKIVLKSARRILREIDSTEQEIKKYINGDTGVIRLSTECYTCYHWVPPLLKDFNREFPNVDVRIFPEFTTEPLKELLKGKIDLVITSHPIDDPNISYQEIFTDQQVAVVPAGHPWSKKKYVTAKDFVDETLLIYSPPLESVGIFRNLLFPAGVKPKGVIPIQLTEATVEMIKAGMGVKVMALWAIKPYLSSNRLVTVPITKHGMQRTWYAATLSHQEPPNFLSFFIENLCLKCIMSDMDSSQNRLQAEAAL